MVTDKADLHEHVQYIVLDLINFCILRDAGFK